MAIYSVLFGLCFGVAWYLSKGITRAIFLTGIVFCIGDILDRYYFKIDKFQWNDLLLIIFAIYYIRKAYAREIRTTK